MNELTELRHSLNETARVARANLLFLMVVGFFYAILIAKTSDLKLLREDNLDLPLLGFGVPLLMFYIVAPVVYLFLNFNLFLRLIRIAEIARLVRDRLLFLLPGERRLQTALLYPFDFLQLILNVREHRGSVLLAWLVVFVLLVLTPLLLLLWLQLRFLAYQNELMTLLHQLVVTLQCILLILFSLFVFRIMNHCPWHRWWNTYRDVYRSYPVLAVGTISILALLMSWRILVVPDSLLERTIGWKAATVWIFSDWWMSEDISREHLLTSGDLEVLYRGSMRRPELAENRRSGLFRRYLHIEGQRISSNELSDEAIATYVATYGDTTEGWRYSDFLDLKERSLRYGIFDFSQFKKVNLISADLYRARLRNVELYGAAMEDTKLHLTDLTGAKLHGANLSNAELYGTDFGCSDPNAGCNAAELHGAEMQRSKLLGVNMENTELVGANMTRAVLSGVKLGGAKLYGANLSRTKLFGVDFRCIYTLDNMLSPCKFEDWYGGDLSFHSIRFSYFPTNSIRKPDNWPAIEEDISAGLSHRKGWSTISDSEILSRLEDVRQNGTEAEHSGTQFMNSSRWITSNEMVDAYRKRDDEFAFGEHCVARDAAGKMSEMHIESGDCHEEMVRLACKESIPSVLQVVLEIQGREMTRKWTRKALSLLENGETECPNLDFAARGVLCRYLFVQIANELRSGGGENLVEKSEFEELLSRWNEVELTCHDLHLASF